jgi:transposase
MAPKDVHPTSAAFLIPPDRPALFVSLELSRSTWLVTALASGSDRMSKYATPGGNGAALIELVNR